MACLIMASAPTSPGQQNIQVNRGWYFQLLQEEISFFFRLKSVTNQGNTFFKVGTAGFSVLSRWESPISRIRIPEGCKRRFCSVKGHQFAISLQIPGKNGIKNSRENRVCKCKGNYDCNMLYVLVRGKTHLNQLPSQHKAASELCNVHPLEITAKYQT